MKTKRDNWVLAKRGLLYDVKDINKLAKFSTEKLDHWTAKCLLFYILREMKHDVLSEFEITGVGIGDILDLNTMTQYEIETRNARPTLERYNEKYKQTGIELIIIQTKYLPTNITKRYRRLKKYIVPD